MNLRGNSALLRIFGGRERLSGLNSARRCRRLGLGGGWEEWRMRGSNIRQASGRDWWIRSRREIASLCSLEMCLLLLLFPGEIGLAIKE